MLLQRIINDVVDGGLVVREAEKLLWPAVDLASLVIHDAAAQGLVSGDLVGCAQRGMDVQAPGVGGVAILGVNELAHGFGQILCMDCIVVCAGAHAQRLLFGGLSLRRGDEAVFQHPVDDVELARACPLGVVDGVVSRWRFWQAGQHGRFGDGDLLQGFAEIGF